MSQALLISTYYLYSETEIDSEKSKETVKTIDPICLVI